MRHDPRPRHRRVFVDRQMKLRSVTTDTNTPAGIAAELTDLWDPLAGWFHCLSWTFHRLPLPFLWPFTTVHCRSLCLRRPAFELTEKD